MRRRIGLVSFVLMGVIVLAVFAVPRPRPALAPELTLAQTEQRARQFMQNSFSGVVTQATARRARWKEVYGEPLCSPVKNFLSVGKAAAGRDPYNPCNANTPLWIVSLQGTFHWPESTFYSSDAVFSSDGGFISFYYPDAVSSGEFISITGGVITP